MNPIDKYGRFIEQRQGIWHEKYSPAVIEALIEEVGILTGGLEQILQESSVVPTKAGINDFYRDEKFRDLALDETKTADLSQEQKEVVKFIAAQTLRTNAPRRAGQYHHSSYHAQIKKFLFEYWKKNEPAKFKEIMEAVIKGSISSRFLPPRIKRYYSELESKPYSDIVFEDISKGGDVLYANPSLPFVTATRHLLNSLVKKGVLQITPGYRRNAFSVSESYLN